MCGIAGVVGPDPVPATEAMVRAMAHRGPDGSGVLEYAGESACLGHARLSIIDLSERAAQPMSDPTGRFTITYNGEIYNYREVRSELEDMGYSFRSDSDTEVALVAYAHWGSASLARFRGMFAFAILDRGGDQGAAGGGAASLFLARDRLGIKPLLYACLPGGFIFASEMKGLLASGLLDRKIDPSALVDYLSYGSVQQPGTMVMGVRHLPPGCHVTVTLDGRIGEPVRYWDLVQTADTLRPGYSDMEYGELVEETRRILDESTRYHMVSDVPVGAFLSGGVDSAAVVALMARRSAEPIRSFTLGFEENPYVKDELGNARQTAGALGCDHREHVVTAGDVPGLFDGLIHAIDQPSMDGTNTYLVSRAASGHVKVVLSGLGGDELFAGYPHFTDIARSVAHPAGDPLSRLLKSAHVFRPNPFTLPFYRRAANLEEQLAGLRRIMFLPSVRRALADGILPGQQPGKDLTAPEAEAPGNLSPMAAGSLFEVQNYLLNTLLRDVDAVSMASSLEVRPVLLDHLLVTHALALPDEARIRNGRFKAALVDAVKDLVPPGVWSRPKRGFELPIRTWLSGPLAERADDTLSSTVARLVFSPSFLRSQRKKVRNQRGSRYTWAWIILIEWMNATGCTP